jgi:hypothetical protein
MLGRLYLRLGGEPRRERLRTAMREGREAESLALAEQGIRSRIDGGWHRLRRAEIALELGDPTYVRSQIDADRRRLSNPRWRALYARALMQDGAFAEAEAIALELVAGGDTPEGLRLVRALPASERLLDAACAAFSRSARTPYRKATQVSHLIEIAVAAGAIDRAFALIGQALAWLDGAQPLRPTFERRDISVELDRALADFHAMMEGLGEFFLISGTLLGVMRDGQLLGYDKDIDVGVFDPSLAARVREAALRSFSFSTDFSSNIEGVKVRHRNGVVIDVFVHHVQGGSMWHGGRAHAWENSVWWGPDEDRFETVDYQGRRYLAPSDWRLYLSENYGDWRKPVKEYNASLQASNRRIREPRLAQLYARQNLVKWFHRADFRMLADAMTLYESEYGADDFLREARRVMLADPTAKSRATAPDAVPATNPRPLTASEPDQEGRILIDRSAGRR